MADEENPPQRVMPTLWLTSYGESKAFYVDRLGFQIDWEHALKRALPAARVGGPHSTGPGSEQAAQFLRNSLEHVVRGKNYVTGKTGSPIDYVGFHAKGRPKMVDGRPVECVAC